MCKSWKQNKFFSLSNENSMIYLVTEYKEMHAQHTQEMKKMNDFGTCWSNLASCFRSFILPSALFCVKVIMVNSSRELKTFYGVEKNTCLFITKYGMVVISGNLQRIIILSILQHLYFGVQFKIHLPPRFTLNWIICIEIGSLK